MFRTRRQGLGRNTTNALGGAKSAKSDSSAQTACHQS
jgi:hypothetical protein